jgi:hypothetical protein
MKNQVMAGVLVALASLSWAQTTTSASPTSLPTTKLEFVTTGGTAVTFPSKVMYRLPLCSSKGVCYAMFVLNPATGPVPVANSFDLSGQSHVINPNTIDKMGSTQVLGLAPVERGVAVLFHGVTSDDNVIGQSKTAKSDTQPSKVKVRVEGDFLALYNPEGTLRSVHHLDLRFQPWQIATLGSDQFMLLGFDKLNQRPVIVSVDTSGEIIRFLDQEGALPSADEYKSLIEKLVGKNRAMLSSDPAVQNVATLSVGISALEFGYTGDRLLLLRPGTDAQLWSISPGGAIQTVKLKIPHGLKADSILSTSDGSWLIRAFVSEDTATLLEFDPESGEVRRQIDSQTVPATSIFYKKNDTYYAVWWNGDQSLIVKSK